MGGVFFWFGFGVSFGCGFGPGFGCGFGVSFGSSFGVRVVRSERHPTGPGIPVKQPSCGCRSARAALANLLSVSAFAVTRAATVWEASGGDYEMCSLA